MHVLSGKRSSLAATLGGSAVLGEEGRILCIGVPGLTPFQRGQLEKTANKQLIMELISESFGRPLGVRFDEVIGEPTVAPAPREKRASGPSTSPDGVRRLADLFDGDIVGPA